MKRERERERILLLLFILRKKKKKKKYSFIPFTCHVLVCVVQDILFQFICLVRGKEKELNC